MFSELFGPLAGLENLEYVELFMNRGIRDFTPLANKQKLVDLNIYYCQIQDVTPLTTCTNLKRLWLGECGLSDGQIGKLRGTYERKVRGVEEQHGPVAQQILSVQLVKCAVLVAGDGERGGGVMQHGHLEPPFCRARTRPVGGMTRALVDLHLFDTIT